MTAADPDQPEELGRREASKRATRAAIQAAADRLIAERGFEAATVREIADAAGVTERTFYRYFDGKEGIVASGAQVWLDRLRAAILARPDDEPPLLAVRRAMLELAAEIGTVGSPAPGAWLFAGATAPVELMRRAGMRPLFAFERAIENAVAERGLADEVAAGLVARLAVTALRTVGPQWRRSLGQGATDVTPGALLDAAFALIAETASSAA